MWIIVKFQIKNLFEKKFRTFLILFSIIISTALFFAAGGMTNTLSKIITERVNQYVGSSEIIVVPGAKSSTKYFNTSGAMEYKDETEYIIGAVQGSANYKKSRTESLNVSVLAINLENLNKLSSVILEQEKHLTPFSGNKVIIGKYTSLKHNINAGDWIKLEVAGKVRDFFVSGVAYPTGVFVDETQSIFMVMPETTLSSFENSRGSVSIIYIKLKDSSKKQEMIHELSKVYSRYDVMEPIAQDELKDVLGKMTMPYLIMTFVVAFMSMFIIYSSFKVITAERLPALGTLRSVGATRKITNMILLSESALYGMLGGIFGCLLGIGVLYLMAMITVSGAGGMEATVGFSHNQVIAGMMFAMVLCIVSSIIPILSVSKLPIRDIVLNTVQKQYKKKIINLYFSILLFVVSFIIPRIIPYSKISYIVGLAINTVCIIVMFFAAVLITPFFVSIFVKVLEKIYVFIFGNVGILSAKNLRGNKSILNNISLITIGVSTILLINIISSSVTKEVMGIYVNSMKFDISVWASNSDKSFAGLLSRVDGVEDVYPVYEAYSIDVADTKKKIGSLVGIDKEKYFDYWKINIDNKDKVFEEFDYGRNIVISNTLRERFDVGIGDKIDLNMGGRKKSYYVSGFFNTLVNDGDIALIPEKFFKLDINPKYYSSVYIKTSDDPNVVANVLRRQFSRRYIYAQTTEEQRISNQQSNDQTFAILNAFSILAMIIGIFGIFNNLFICFIERRRLLAVMRSVGMSKKQIKRMIFVEAVTSGFSGGVLGVLTGVLMLSVAPYILKVITGAIYPMHFSISIMIGAIITAILVILVASVGPSIKSSRLSIIESIKYE